MQVNRKHVWHLAAGASTPGSSVSGSVGQGDVVTGSAEEAAGGGEAWTGLSLWFTSHPDSSAVGPPLAFQRHLSKSFATTR